MSLHIKQLRKDLLLCLSSNAYYLNIILNDQVLYRVDSEDKIIYFNSLKEDTFIERQNGQSNQTETTYFILFNRNLQWTIFTFTNQQPPRSLLHGKLQIESIQSNKVAPIVVNVHQISNKLLVILSDFTIHQIVFNQNLKKALFQHLKSNPVKQKQSFFNPQLKSQIIYPNQEINLSQLYLGVSQSSYIKESMMMKQPNDGVNNKVNVKENVKSNEQNYVLYLVIKMDSKNYGDHSYSKRQQSQLKITNSYDNTDGNTLQLHSLYCLLLDGKQGIIRSGRQSLLNIQGNFIGMYSLNQNHLILQINQKLYLWQVYHQQEPQIIVHSSHFNNPLTLYQRSQLGQSWTSIVQDTQNKSNGKKVFSILKISFKQKGLQFQQLLKFSLNNLNPLLYLRNTINNQESYVFFSDMSIHKVQNMIKNDLTKPIITQHNGYLNQAKVINLQPGTVIMYLNKNTAFFNQSLIFTNSLLQTSRNIWTHNLPLQLSKLIHLNTKENEKGSNKNEKLLILSSPIIGTLGLSLSLTDSHDIQLKINDTFKPISGYQCLGVSQSCKSFLNHHQIVFNLQSNKSQKYQSLSASKMFENSRDFIQNGLFLQNSQIYLLTVDQQIHAFQGNSASSFKRKFIHCFNRPIKKIHKLNQVNLITVQFYSNHSQTFNFNHQIQQNLHQFQIFIVKQDQITLYQTVNYNSLFDHGDLLSFLTHINTVPYYFNFFHGKIIIASSETTHRYNPQKLKIQIHEIPFPYSKIKKFSIVPLINFSIEPKKDAENEFLLLIQENQKEKCRIFIGSFMQKYLIKNFEEIKLSYESILSSIDLNDQKALFSTVQVIGDGNQKVKNLVIFTQNSCYSLILQTGSIKIPNIFSETKRLLQSLFKLNVNDNLQEYKGIEKIQGPVTIIEKQIYQDESNDSKNRFKRNTSSCEVLLLNRFQLWYGLKNISQKKIDLVSVFTRVNNDFLQFRNNLSVDQLDESEFMKIFSQKLPIVQVKFLTTKAIIVLFEQQITILEIGQNGSLIVKQEIVFSKIVKKELKKQNSLEDNQMNELSIKKDHNYSSIKIIQLLDSFSSTDIFLKDSQERLYLLIYDFKRSIYWIEFYRNLQQDILSITRTRYWDQSKISVPMYKYPSSHFQTKKQNQKQEIIIKKDTQILVKNLSTHKQKSYYL